MNQHTRVPLSTTGAMNTRPVSNIAAATRTDSSSVGADNTLSASVTHEDQLGVSSHGDQSVFSTVPNVAAHDPIEAA